MTKYDYAHLVRKRSAEEWNALSDEEKNNVGKANERVLSWMRFDQEILDAHAEFGGYIRHLQALYDWPCMMVEIEILRSKLTKATNDLRQMIAERENEIIAQDGESYMLGKRDGYEEAKAKYQTIPDEEQ